MHFRNDHRARRRAAVGRAKRGRRHREQSVRQVTVRPPAQRHARPWPRETHLVDKPHRPAARRRLDQPHLVPARPAQVETQLGRTQHQVLARADRRPVRQDHLLERRRIVSGTSPTGPPPGASRCTVRSGPAARRPPAQHLVDHHVGHRPRPGQARANRRTGCWHASSRRTVVARRINHFECAAVAVRQHRPRGPGGVLELLDRTPSGRSPQSVRRRCSDPRGQTHPPPASRCRSGPQTPPGYGPPGHAGPDRAP